MELARTNPCDPVVFQPHRRRRHRHRHHHHYHSDSDTDSTYSASTYSSDSDDSTYYRVAHPRRARRWLRWPRGVVTYPGYSPWVPAGAAVGGGVVGGIVQGTGLVGAATVFPQLHTQVQQQQQQQQPRRYGYRRFHHQGGERVRGGCGHGHGHGHHHHHHDRRARSPRRCILPRFGRWLIGDPPERRQWRRCDDGGDCCGDGCGVGTTPTVHHEDEYWGPGRTNTVPNWAYGPDGSRNSPWRYGGPNGNTTTSGPDAIDPGGTIEEVEEGGTAPVQTAQTLPTTAVLPLAAADPYDAQHQPHTHYHLNDDNGSSRRRRHGHSHSHGRSHGRRRRRDHNDDDGILRLIDRERRRDSERQMADADASHRREAMMMGLVDRERDRDRGGGSSGAGLDARDVLGMLLDREAERRRRGEDTAAGGRERGGSSSGGGGVGGGEDGWKGALDALSRRVDEMVLLGGREEGGRTADRVAAPARRKKNTAPKVKFTKDGDNAGAGIRPSGGKRSGAPGGKIIFSRGRDGDQDDDGGSDADSDETSGPSSVGGGTSVTTRGRALRRAGSPSTCVD